jgi:IS6 family transposase
VVSQGQVVDVFVSKRRHTKAAAWFFSSAICAHGAPAEVTIDWSPALVRTIIDSLSRWHSATPLQCDNNRVEANLGRMKAKPGPMRGLKRDRTPGVVNRGHAFIQDLRRGYYELGADNSPGMTLSSAFDGPVMVVRSADLIRTGWPAPDDPTEQQGDS